VMADEADAFEWREDVDGGRSLEPPDPSGAPGHVEPDEAGAGPVDPWANREPAFDPDQAARHETIFALGNGNLGIRGNLEEDAGNVTRGVYVNGFCDEFPISYGESAHAMPATTRSCSTWRTGRASASAWATTRWTSAPGGSSATSASWTCVAAS
jgi:hypothetical protein